MLLRQLLVVPGLCLSLQSCSPAGGDTGNRLEQTPLNNSVSALGRIDTRTRLRQLSPLKNGVLETMNVSVGDLVTTGQVLATLMCNQEQAQLQAATASVDLADAQLAVLEEGTRRGTIAEAGALVLAAGHRAENTTDDYQRQRRIASANFASERNVERLRRESDEAHALQQAAQARLGDLNAGPREVDLIASRARVQMAKASVQQAQAAVANCSLRSPLDGVVLRIARQPGEFVAGGTGDHVVTIADTQDLIVRAEIEERDIGRVKIGAPVALRFIGEDAVYLGEVYEMTGVVGRQTARSTDPANRFDRDTLEVMVRLESESGDHGLNGFAIGRQILVDIGS